MVSASFCAIQTITENSFGVIMPRTVPALASSVLTIYVSVMLKLLHSLHQSFQRGWLGTKQTDTTWGKVKSWTARHPLEGIYITNTQKLNANFSLRQPELHDNNSSSSVHHSSNILFPVVHGKKVLQHLPPTFIGFFSAFCSWNESSATMMLVSGSYQVDF